VVEIEVEFAAEAQLVALPALAAGFEAVKMVVPELALEVASGVAVGILDYRAGDNSDLVPFYPLFVFYLFITKF